MHSTPVTNFRLPLPLLARIDEARGDEPRTAWFIRACEAALAAEQQTAADGEAAD